jgi:L-threonylcarbamoyladenylate synthase
MTSPSDRSTAAAAALSAEGLAARLARGSAAIFPTDTLPALAAVPEAAAELWRLKRRPADKPLILMGADLAQLREALQVSWHPAWLEQARLCWPGAVTLVLPIQGPFTEALHPGGTSLGLRVPACDAARRLLRRSGPLATTSANISGEPPVRDPQEAPALFPGVPLLGPLPWQPGSGQASTVIAWQSLNQRWQLLRPGAEPPPR